MITFKKVAIENSHGSEERIRRWIARGCWAAVLSLSILGLFGCDFFYQLLGIRAVADAGKEQTVTVGSLVTLDGSNSRDSKGGTALTYLWKFTATPPASAKLLAMTSPDEIKAYFTPDATGVFFCHCENHCLRPGHLHCDL